MRPTTLPRLTLALSLAAVGCGASRPAPRVYRYADLVRAPETGKDMMRAPIVLEFAPGDRLPIQLGFSDASFSLDPATPQLALVAKERCFVRIDGTGGGIHKSRELATLGERSTPGTFGVGFEHSPTGPALIVQVTTPGAQSSSQ